MTGVSSGATRAMAWRTASISALSPIRPKRRPKRSKGLGTGGGRRCRRRTTRPASSRTVPPPGSSRTLAGMTWLSSTGRPSTARRVGLPARIRTPPPARGSIPSGCRLRKGSASGSPTVPGAAPEAAKRGCCRERSAVRPRASSPRKARSPIRDRSGWQSTVSAGRSATLSRRDPPGTFPAGPPSVVPPPSCDMGTPSVTPTPLPAPAVSPAGRPGTDRGRPYPAR